MASKHSFGGASAVSRRQFVRTVAAGAAIATVPRTFAPSARGAETQSSRKRSLRLGHLTDVHVQPERDATRGFAAALKHVHAQSDAPTLLINGGDAVMDTLETDRARTDVQWREWQRTVKEFCPTRLVHCLGNHDVWGWNRAASKTTSQEPGWGKHRWRDEVGLAANYHSFDAGGWHFVILDSIFPDSDATYIGRLDDEQWEWLRADLKNTPATMPIAIVSHIPILSVAWVEFEKSLEERPSRRRSVTLVDAKELVELFRQHPNVKLCLSGHLHLVERVEYSGVTYICTGAVSGNWWKGPHINIPEGYGLVDLYDNGTVDYQYVTYGWDAQRG